MRDQDRWLYRAKGIFWVPGEGHEVETNVGAPFAQILPAHWNPNLNLKNNGLMNNWSDELHEHLENGLMKCCAVTRQHHRATCAHAGTHPFSTGCPKESAMWLVSLLWRSKVLSIMDALWSNVIPRYANGSQSPRPPRQYTTPSASCYYFLSWSTSYYRTGTFIVLICGRYAREKMPPYFNFFYRLSPRFATRHCSD